MKNYFINNILEDLEIFIKLSIKKTLNMAKKAVPQLIPTRVIYKATASQKSLRKLSSS